MIFRYDDREYRGASSVEIIEQLAREARGFAARDGNLVTEYLQWSLARLADRLPPREIDVSDRLGDEALARSYLLMRAEYQLGELLDDGNALP